MPGQRAVGVHHERTAVKHQLVLTANLVQIDQRQPGLDHPADGVVNAHIRLAGLERRAVRDQQQLATGLGDAFVHVGGPDVLADRHADAHIVEIYRSGERARIEHALFIEHPIIRQIMLVARRADRAVLEQHHRVV